jgi:hypothetical protein
MTLIPCSKYLKNRMTVIVPYRSLMLQWNGVRHRRAVCFLPRLQHLVWSEITCVRAYTMALKFASFCAGWTRGTHPCHLAKRKTSVSCTAGAKSGTVLSGEVAPALSLPSYLIPGTINHHLEVSR